MINFKLRDFDKISPVGQEPDLYLSWFWLTDGDLWLKFGDQTIYEYSKEAIQYFEKKQSPYNDYYIVRFLEDFTGIFEKLSVSVPDHLYKLTADLSQFEHKAKIWLDIYETDEDQYSDFYFEEYHKLLSWIYDRHFDSAHLIGGPHLYFFRCKDRIRIVWQTEHILENGIDLWTAKNGHIEMSFTDFVQEVKQFGQAFFAAMDLQIGLTVDKDWQNIKVDKARLIEEQKERKQAFDKNVSFLEQRNDDVAYWAEIATLYDRMQSEIG